MSSGALRVERARKQGSNYGFKLESGQVKELPRLAVSF